MSLQSPRAFNIDPEILDTDSSPADRFVYSAQYIAYYSPGIDKQIQLPPYRGSYVGQLASTMSPDVRERVLKEYPAIRKYAEQLAKANEKAHAPGGAGKAAPSAAQVERDAKHVLELSQGHLDQPAERAKFLAALKQVSSSGHAFLAPGASGGGEQINPPGSVSPEQQLAMAMASEIGFLFLDRTRIRPIGFAVGEFVYSLSLAPGEEVTIEQKTYSKRETTFEDMNDQESTLDLEISSNLTSELTEGLNQENSQLSRDSETGGVHVGVQYEGINVQAGPTTTDSVDDGHKTTSTTALKNTQTSSSKVAAKYRAQHKVTFTVSTENRYESTSKRVIKNPNPYTPIDLLYFKMNQKLKLSQERYGVRLCWAPAVRDPASGFYARLQALKDALFAAAAQASAGPRPVPPDPPATQDSSIVLSSVTNANKFDWFNGSQSNDYEVEIDPPPGFIWDGDASFVTSSLMFTFSGSRPAGAEVRGPSNAGAGMKCLVHVGIENKVWVDNTTSPPSVRYEGTGSAFFTVQARFITTTVPGNDDYNQQLAQWRAADAQWQAQDAQVKADALAKAQAQWDELRAEQLADVNPLDETFGLLIWQLFPAQYRDDAGEIDMWQRLFDWRQASLKLYPAWWAGGPLREPTLPPDHFLNASWARLYLPIRPGAEDQALRWIYQLTATAPLFQGVDQYVKDLVDQVSQYRQSMFGSDAEVVVTEVPGQCPTAEVQFECLGTWEESLPTDGTHLEVLQATTLAADDDSRQRLADAAAHRTEEIERLKRDNELRASVNQSGPGTVNTEVRVKLSERPKDDEANQA